MTEKILIPLDGSKLGEAALIYVEKFLSNLSLEGRVEVALIQVITPPSGSMTTRDDIIQEASSVSRIGETEELEKTALEYLEGTGEILRRKGTKVECRVMISDTGASSAEAILKAEEDLKADMVAMSTHGRRGLSRWVFGSITEKVLRASNIPVLVVKAQDVK